MAKKRMFSLGVLDTDAFLDMPLSAQALYFHLNLRADDDGFVGNPKRITQNVGANIDDLKLLVAKRFVLAFEDGVIVIKHWRMHNAIKKDRYTATNYTEDLRMLDIKDNGAYTLRSKTDVPQLEHRWSTNGAQMEQTCSADIGKVSKDKNSLDKARASTIAKARLERGADEEEAVVDEDLSRVMTFYSEYVSKAIPSSLQTQSIIDFINELGADVVIHAMEITAESDSRGWRYLKKILERYRDNGLTSIEAVIEDEGRYLQKIDTGVRKNGNSGVDNGRSRKKWDIHTDAG